MGLEITVLPVFGQKLDTQNELGQNEAGQINHLLFPEKKSNNFFPAQN